MSLDSIRAMMITGALRGGGRQAAERFAGAAPAPSATPMDAAAAPVRPPAAPIPEPALQAPSASSEADTRAPAIVVSDVTKRYRLGKDNHVYALRGASVRVEAGEMVAIVGPSGSGKSTMMHLIGCLDTPDTGEVHINGRRADRLRGRALTRLRGTEIGFIFQGFNLVPTMTAVENIALAAEYQGVPKSEGHERARELMELVGLPDRGKHLPSELSGGQQQRVAIARALMNRPAIVLGDEPTGDLDTATSDEIVALMREINLTTGTTFVIVTHNPEVAEACDRTIRMRDGRVEGTGDAPAEEPAAANAPARDRSFRPAPAFG